MTPADVTKSGGTEPEDRERTAAPTKSEGRGQDPEGRTRGTEATMSGTREDRVLLPTATGAESLAALRGMLRGHRLLAAGAITVLVAGTAVGLLTAPLLGHIVDLVVDRKGASALTLPLVLLVVVAIARGAAAAVGSTLVARLGETVLAALREQFIERALRLPLDRVEAAGSGDLVSRVTSDVSMIGKSVRQALPEFSRSALTILLTFVGLAVLDWRFLLAALLAAPVQALSVRWYLRRAAPVYGEHRIATGALQHQLLDSVGGVRTVRAFRLNATHADLLERRSEAARDLGLRGIHIVTGFFSRLNLAEFIGLAAMLGTGFVLVDAGSVSIGTATAAALYFHSLFNPINATLFLLDDAQSAGASFARLVGVSGLPAERAPSGHHTLADGSVEVSALSHAYGSGAPVLHEVDLRVRSGERVALVGASGGKTTLAKLVAGVHAPTGGSIRLGGVDAGELGPAGVRRAVALISQEVHVFSRHPRGRPAARPARGRRRGTARGARPGRSARVGAGAARGPGHGRGRGRAPADGDPGAASRAGPARARGPAHRDPGRGHRRRRKQPAPGSWRRRPPAPSKAVRDCSSRTGCRRPRRPTGWSSSTRAGSWRPAPMRSWWRRAAGTPTCGPPGPTAVGSPGRRCPVRRPTRTSRSHRPAEEPARGKGAARRHVVPPLPPSRGRRVVRAGQSCRAMRLAGRRSVQWDST